MHERRWLNLSQPQTLQIVVFLLYLNAVFIVLNGGLADLRLLLLAVANVGAGFGIANEQKWAYALGVAVAVFPFVYRLLFAGIENVLGRDLLNLMFEVALVALLVHPQSRDYQRIWFK